MYQWQVSEDSVFTSPKSGTTSDTSVTALDLKTSTIYYWRVRVTEPSLSSWSQSHSFTTIIGGYTGAPSLITPTAGSTIVDDTPMFTWSRVTSITNYHIQVATNPSFGATDIVIDEELGDVEAYVVKEADALDNGNYYWHVKGTSSTIEGPWSALGSFTLDAE
jgi:hypothetical protein